MSWRIEIIDKKEFVATALNNKDKTFVVYMVALNMDLNGHLSQKAQIGLLDIEKVIISSKYANYINIFSLDVTTKLPEHTRINNHLIDLMDDKQSLYDPIYSLKLVKLETLKIYIKTNLANGFIDCLSYPPVLQYCLSARRTVAFDCVLIIKILTTWLSRFNIHCPWLINLSIA